MGNKKVEIEKSLKMIGFGYWLIVSIIMLLGLMLTFGAPYEIGSGLSTVSMVLIVFFLFGYLGLGANLKDERLGKIASRAMTISWGFTLISTAALATLRSTYLPEIDGGQILGIIIFVLVSSMAVSNEVYKRKGDINW